MSFGDGIHLFELAGVSHESEAGAGDGYDDFTNVVFDLEQGSAHSLTLSTGYGDQYFRVWIDFNDDYIFTSDELIVDNFVLAAGQAGGTYTGSTDFVVPEDAQLGQHVMRAKTNWNAPVPDDACEETQYGATEDYTANIVESLSIVELPMNNSNLLVFSNDNESFTVKLLTSYSEPLSLNIYDVRGRTLLSDNMIKTDSSSYLYNLNMSDVEAGVYLLKIGDSSVGFKTTRIIVK